MKYAKIKRRKPESRKSRYGNFFCIICSRKLSRVNSKTMYCVSCYQKRPEIREMRSRIALERGYGKWMIGKKLSKEHSENIGKGNIGKKRSYRWKLSEETKKKMSDSKKGERCNFWKGGVTSKNILIRTSSKYKSWRTSVFQRDNFTCQICNKRGAEIHADHIKPFAYFPDLRFDINNGRTLCVPCHKNTETYLNKRNGWSEKFDNCAECGTNEIKHNAKGYCIICYGRKRRLNIR